MYIFKNIDCLVQNSYPNIIFNTDIQNMCTITATQNGHNIMNINFISNIITIYDYDSYKEDILIFG